MSETELLKARQLGMSEFTADGFTVYTVTFPNEDHETLYYEFDRLADAKRAAANALSTAFAKTAWLMVADEVAAIWCDGEWYTLNSKWTRQ